MKQKRLLLLGGLRYLIPVIKAAHDLGIYVITCDYIPDNIAHKYSDEYHNVSIIDKEAVLKLAKKIKIDGIMSFAVDPGVVAAAFVAEKLGLPGCPYESVKTLQNKDLFRKFLRDHHFNVPNANGYDESELNSIDASIFNFPVIVKPVDSAGSKGVTKVESHKKLKSAIKVALSYSFSKRIIIEEFIKKKGFSSDTDCFSVNGKMKFFSFSNQYFDANAKNPYTPAAYSWPSTIDSNNQEELKKELQRLIDLLNLGTSIYNIEVREGVDGKAYIMEMSPRGGGNRLSEVLHYATGVDLIKNAVRAAIGEFNSIDIVQKPYNAYWAEIIVHANRAGKFQELVIDKEIKKRFVVEVDLWVKQGDDISEFNGANDAIGTLILKFDTKQQMEWLINNQSDWLTLLVD